MLIQNGVFVSFNKLKYYFSTHCFVLIAEASLFLYPSVKPSHDVSSVLTAPRGFKHSTIERDISNVWKEIALPNCPEYLKL